MMLLKNCRLSDERIVDILIADKKIAMIGKDLEAEYEIDIKNNYVLPGIIDPHVHFREPGLTQKEDFMTGSMAAAAGGITTFLDMPNTVPPTTTIRLLEEKRKLAKKSIVNYGFHFGGAADNIDEIIAAKNIASVKVFMNISTGKLMIDDEDALEMIFEKSATVAVHAEKDMVKKAIMLAKRYNTRLYLCHIALREELDVIEKEKDNNIFAEATPHHLFLSTEDDEDNFTKMKPSLKSPMDQEYLRRAVNSGLIDTIGSDHAPHTIGEKLGSETVYGIPGCETLLPLMLDGVNSGLWSLERVEELCCKRPAEIFGIKDKGRIEVGYDADLTVIDMNMVKQVEDSRLYTKCRWSPFEGRTLKGWPVLTIVGGDIAFDGSINKECRGKEVEFEQIAYKDPEESK